MFLCMTSNVRIWCPGNVPCRCPSAPATMSTLPSKIPLGARIEPSGHRLLETGWPFVGIGRVLKGRVGRNFRLHSAGALLTPNSQKVPSKLKCYRSNYRCIGYKNGWVDSYVAVGWQNALKMQKAAPCALHGEDVSEKQTDVGRSSCPETRGSVAAVEYMASQIVMYQRW